MATATGSDEMTFHWLDYLVFVIIMVISLAIGLFFALTGNRQSTLSEFLLAGRNIPMVPGAISMLASFLSGVYLIGIPLEVYLNGTLISLMAVGYVLMDVIAAHVFIPIMYNIGMTSINEYLERRFNLLVRVLGALTFIVMMVLYMAVVLYAPALAFSVVTGLSMWISIMGCGLICTIYTVLGGMKAVIWTDTFQMLVIVGGTLALVIIGVIDVGGLTEVWNIADRGGRIEFESYSADPRVRHTLWTQSIGSVFQFLAVVAINQTQVQRYVAMKSLKKAQTAQYLIVIMSLISLFLVTLLGLVMYAYFVGCDPIITGQLERPDQLVPHYMMKVIGHLHGLPGLFTACVFCAALSTVSSAVNSLAAVCIEDIVKPTLRIFKMDDAKDTTYTWITKGLALFFGFVSIGMSYLAPYMGDNLIQVCLSIFGTAGGPLFGVFVLAIFFPCVNSAGAVSGLVVSLGVTYWVSIEAILEVPFPSPKPLSFMECPFNVSMRMPSSMPTPYTSPDIMDLYSISYMWYGLLSVVIAVITGLLVSAVTSCWVTRKPLERRLFFVCADECCCCCSVSCRHTCRCGIPMDNEPLEMYKYGGGNSSGFDKPQKKREDSAPLTEDVRKTDGVNNRAFVQAS